MRKLSGLIGSTAVFGAMTLLSRLAGFARDVLQAVAARDGDELCVIGGGEVYALALPLATHMRLTLVDTVVEGADAFFPRFDAGTWREISREPHGADAAHAFAFEFVDYARIG